MIESVESQLHIAENFQKLQGWLFASGYVVTDVPADGDCACWSLLSLMRKDPFISFRDKACKEACQQIREDLVQLWKSVSKKPQWQRFYEELSFDPEQPEVPQTREEEQNLSHSQTSVKSEMLKTPSKRRPQPTIHIDLLTPEKAPEAHHRLEVVCNQKGAIDLKKKKRSEIDIPSASQKRAKLPAAEAAEGDGQVMPPKKEKEDAKVNSSRQAFQTKMENEFPLDEGRQSKRTDIKKKPKDERNEEDKAKGEETAEAEGKQKKKRQRTCKSKVKTAEERKLAAVKAYLASKGITWPFCQKYHRRLGLPGAHECKSLTNLHASLMELEEPSCTTCLAMLKAQSASLEELKMSLEEAVDKEKYPDSPGISQLRKVSAATFLDDIEVEKSTPVPIEPDQSRALDPLDPQNLQMELNMKDEEENLEENMEAEEDPFVTVNRCPYLELLPPNTCDRRFPIRCLLRKSHAQPLGRVFEGSAPRKKVVDNFVRQHLKAVTHIAAAARAAAALSEHPPIQQGQHDVQNMSACQGLSPTHGESSRSGAFANEFLLWARFTKLAKSFTKHSYVYSIAEQEVKVHHEECEKVTGETDGQGRFICTMCQKNQLVQASLKSAIRFALKHWAARILQARLFKSDEAREEIQQEFRKTALYR
ncbi:Uncharacterized protein SCF082_LOCUS24356, partial [Durusdinium trenchii]